MSSSSPESSLLVASASLRYMSERMYLLSSLVSSSVSLSKAKVLILSFSAFFTYVFDIFNLGPCVIVWGEPPCYCIAHSSFSFFPPFQRLPLVSIPLVGFCLPFWPSRVSLQLSVPPATGAHCRNLEKRGRGREGLNWCKTNDDDDNDEKDNY
jgi:hypothetical protein